MTFKVMPEVQLRVDSAYPGDQGGGKARLDPETMLALKISPGDLVAIEGKRRTVAKVWRALVEDWNQRKIRIDNFTRQNAGVSIGDNVKVVKIVDEIEAKRVVLAPPEDLPKKIPIANNPHVVNSLIDFPVAKNDTIPIMLGLPFIQPQIVGFKIVEVEPEEAVIITKNTSIEFSDKPAAGFEGIKRFSYEDIGGLKDELQRLRETIELPLRHPELFQKLGIEPPKGVLLYGPPGTGKTLIAKAVASESGAHFIHIAGPEVISKYYGESEQKLRDIFDEARENAPSIIFIDELDSIAPRREDVTGEVERRVVAQLLTMMDGLEERGQVVVIGATNRVDAIDAALRRPGRFDREIEIGVPSEPDRIEIMKIHTRGMPLSEDVNLDTLGQQTHGFVGADLAALAREAAIRALRRYLPDLDLDAEEIPQDVLDMLKVYASDFRSAQRDVGPSAMREVMLEVSHVKWQNVGGLDAAKIEVREAIELPLKDRQRIDDLGIEPPRGILLYGPPGTGKTLIAKAVASESGANFIPVRGPQLLSKWVGESERAVREIFKKARQVAPSIIFFDELDALAPERGRSSDSHVLDNVLNQILTEMDGLIELKDVVIMGATNRPEMVDPALLRAGRFDRLVYIGEPAFEDRISILNVHSKYMPIEGTSIEEVMELTKPLTEDNLEKILDIIRADQPVTSDVIISAFREIRKRKVEELFSVKKLVLEGFDFDTLVNLTMKIDDSNIDKVFSNLRKEQAVNQEEIKQKLNDVQKLSKKDNSSLNIEFRKRLVDGKIGINALDIPKESYNYLINNTEIFNQGSILEILDVLTKWQSIKSEDIDKITTNFTHKDRIVHSDENRRTLINHLLEQQKLTLDKISVDDLLDKLRHFTDSDLEKIINHLWIKQAEREVRRRKISQLYSVKKLRLEGLSILDLADLTIANKINDNEMDEFLELLWKEQPIREGEIIDHIQSLKLDPDHIELIQRAVRRKSIFDIFETRKIKFQDPQKMVLLRDLASKTDGFVGSDLEALCREAGMLALREGATIVSRRHFDAAQQKVHPTMNDNLRQYYGKVQQHFKGGLPQKVQPPEYQ
jgi:transitional endoplasmic reticulum ATPase